MSDQGGSGPQWGEQGFGGDRPAWESPSGGQQQPGYQQPAYPQQPQWSGSPQPGSGYGGSPPYGANPYQANPYQAAPYGYGSFPQSPKNSGLAIASLCVSLGGFITVGAAGIVGLILGIVALGQVRRSNGQLGGSGLAVAGIVIGALMTIGFILFIVLVVAAANDIHHCVYYGNGTNYCNYYNS